VTVSTCLVLTNSALRPRFAVEHFDTSDHRGLATVGRWDASNVFEALRVIVRFRRALRGSPGLVYLPISQGMAGLTRDTLLIRLATAGGWKVTAHLRGSELSAVCRRQPAPIRRWLLQSFERLDSMAILGPSLTHAVDGLVPPDRIAVVPNGTRDPGLPDKRKPTDTGLYLSNLRVRKGVRQALESAKLVINDRPSARFVFAGDCIDPALAAELADAAAESGGRIEIRSAVSGGDKRDLLASATFLLFPPVEPEGHPRVVLEALAAGLPVIATDRGAIRETVPDGECGFVVDEPEVNVLADRMLRLFGDEELRDRMSRAARERFLSAYSQEIADARLADWLADVAGIA
jgi:glycosyltransferase involved in cell wall biosynthesis